ncbi:MAG: hypothetical protein C4562_01630 [Actinobacteria bacterium]|nr:MAG: hypothetical protein C4562_01630 [Actinomycetota bacterium]
MRKKLTFYFLIITVLLYNFLFSLPTTFAQSSIGSEIKFSKPYYHQDDIFKVSLKLKNKKPSENVYIAVSLTLTDNGSEVYSAEKEVSNKNISTVTFEKSFQKLGLQCGVYPLLIKVSKNGEEITRYETAIAIMPNEKKPSNLLLSIVADFHQGPQLGNKDELLNKNLNNLLKQVASILLVIKKNKQPVFLSFSPMLYRELEAVSANKGSSSNKQAKAVLLAYNSLAKLPNISLAATSYSRAPLNYFQYKKWPQDILYQATHNIFSKKPEVFYPLQGCFNKKTLNFLSSRFDLFFLPSYSVQDPVYRSYKIRKSRAALIDSKATKNLYGNSQAACQKTIARLAYLQMLEEKQNVVAINVTNETNPKTLDLFLKSLKSIDWISFSTKESIQKTKPVSQITINSKKRDYNMAYVNLLRKTRNKVWPFIRATNDDNPVRLKLLEGLLKAEDFSYLTNQKSNRFPLIKIISTVNDELNKISLSSPPVFLTSETGKIPVTVVNNCGYDLNLKLTCKSVDFVVERSAKKVRCRPGENLFILPVTALRSSNNPILINLVSQGAILKSSKVQIKATLAKKFNYYVLIAVIAFFLLLVAALVFREIHHRRKNGK